MFLAIVVAVVVGVVIVGVVVVGAVVVVGVVVNVGVVGVFCVVALLLLQLAEAKKKNNATAQPSHGCHIDLLTPCLSAYIHIYIYIYTWHTPSQIRDQSMFFSQDTGRSVALQR